MKNKYLLIVFALVNLFGKVNAQVTHLQDENPNPATEAIFTGDFNNGDIAVCSFNRAKGMLSMSAELQHDGNGTWDEVRVAFQWGGTWYKVCEFWRDGNNHTGTNYTGYNQTNYEASGLLPLMLGVRSKVNESRTNDANKSVYIYDNGNLQRYNGNYFAAPTTHSRAQGSDNGTFGIQTKKYSASYPFPVKNPTAASGDPQVTVGYEQSSGAGVSYGNMDGMYTYRQGCCRSLILLNLTNLPPDMLASPNFRVHIYSKSNSGSQDRVFETVYSNPNFMTSPPSGLTATQNLCGKVSLSWSNSGANVLPTDGTVNLKYVVFRNGAYLGTVPGTTTTYNDLTAAQDVIYDYTVRHVAFSTSGDTYFKSPETSPAQGQIKPSPDQPITPTASVDKCTGLINLGWGYNGTNPQYFRVDSSRNAAGPFAVLTKTITGSSRSFAHSGVTRGVPYYYRLYAISNCTVMSVNYADVNGISPANPTMATSVTAVTNTVTNSVDVAWLDNANNETKYQIVRTDDIGNTVLTDVNANTSSYNDESAAACRLYTYKIKVFNDCVLSGIVSASQATITLPPPNLGNTFDATHKITASKGYFGNRVELIWGNNNGLNIDIFKIYRKQLGTALDSVQIAAPAAGTALYVDNTADARVFYRYTIVGVKQCNGSELLTNITSDVGFRLPAGLVSGHIEYNGGVAVGGAKVFIQPSGAIVGTAVDIASGGSLTINDNPSLEPGAQMRCEFWLKPISMISSNNVFNKSNSFNLLYNGTNYVASIFTGTVQNTVNIPATSLPTNQWNHVSIVYDGGVLKAFANGIITGSVAATGSIFNSASNLIIGGGTSNFMLDEFRLIGQSSNDSVVAVEKNRILNGDETGFKCNLHFDEAVGNYAYDPSKVGNLFNANHALISNNVTFTSDRPTTSQLGYFGVTDVLGNYISTGIRFIGSGENFNVIPNYLTHSFSPNSRSVYIGDASQVFNNQDFIDNSSFPVSGSLFYKGTTCAVPDAVLKLDGNAIIVNGAQVKTDANGTFSMSVPIGNHYISIEKIGHDMALGGRYPVTGTHNFQAGLSNVNFSDSTLRKVVGRVVGGDVQGDKIANLGKSINNIGKAYIKLESPLTGSPCFTTSVITNTLTGEYEFNIPPIQYKITEAYVMSNSVSINININPTSLKYTSNTFNLTNTNFLKTEKDSIFVHLGTGVNQRDSLIQVDTVAFHHRLDFIHYSTPHSSLTDTLGNRFIGENAISFPTIPVTTITAVPSSTNNWGPLDFPVFRQKAFYKAKISAIQTYTNADTPSLVDTVKLNGLVAISNGMIDGVDPNPNISLTNGVAYYPFTCGSPNTATYTPNFLSYTKAMQINITPEGQPTYSLSPNATTTVSPGYNMYRAYVIGSLLDGTGFATVGPERVDMILRDPPGSGSSSTWSSGTSTTKTENIYNGGGVTQGLSTDISIGTKQYVGLGVAVEIDAGTALSVGLETTISGGKTNSYNETVTTLNEVSTRDDADNVGAAADIFIGRSRNWYMGPTINIELRPSATCSVVNCFGPIVGGYRLAKIAGLSLAPGDVKTRFSYTQNEIEENVIPTLEALRLTYFSRSGARHTSTLSASDNRFGSNNDDPLWGAAASSTTPAIFEKALDRSGPSYTFNYSTGTSTVVTFVNNKVFPPAISTATLPIEVEDSVRIINNQIRLWKETLRDNEKEKHQCITNAAGTLIDNFSLGSAILNNSYSVSFEDAEEKSFEFSLDAAATYTVKAKVAGTGVEFEGGTTLNYSRSVNTSIATTTENTFQYTLTDGDPGDLMSVDVYRMPMGNVFITRGGQTMCPYEDALVLHYYNPADATAWISSHTYNETGYQTIAPATIKREVPEILVDGVSSSTKFNIPSNQAAVFQLVLSNQSLLTVNNSVDLQVRVASISNPNGAILKIDGQNANAIFNIPSGGSVNKVLTVERGPIEINYDSLMVIFSSACTDDIADTSYVSVHFIPTCTDLAITSPNNNFIINNSDSSLANVIIGDYNYNYGVAQNTTTLTSPAHPYYGFEKIGYEIKPSNTSAWLQIQEFYKYPTAVGSNSLFPIPNNQVYTQYSWLVPTQSYADGNYEIRAVSSCYNKDGTYATKYSPVLQGVMDRVNPAPFGTPSPGDGILDPNDDISIQFNEPIDISSLSYAPASSQNSNFDIRGVLNGTALRHSESLNFDGTTDYAEVTGGASLQKRSFTFEFWAKFNSTGAEQTVISQGTDAVQKMAIGFDASNKLKFIMGNQTAVTTNPVTLPTDWHHYAVVYDYPNADVSLFIDGTLEGTNNNFLVDYIGTGKLAFGKALPANNNFLNGNAHEIRLWSKARTISEITVTMNKVLSRNQSGLMYNWKMDEADGTFANDDIRSRNANIVGATWEVNPNGNAVQLSSASNDNIKVSSGNIAINKEMDFTLEFWFNSTQTGVSTLFSNGEGISTTADSLDAWTIQKDAAGAIHVYHKGLDFVASTTNYFNGNWHHFALVMQRTGNLSAYVDGNLQNSVQGINFNNLAGANMYLGAKAVIAGSVTTLSNYYDGKMDEFRLWSTARKTEQVKRDKQNRMLGNEHGLLAYLPFENYTLVLGTPSLTPTFNNQSLSTLTITPQGAVSLIAQTPTIKLPRPIQAVNYTWSLNNDKIILSTNTSPDQLENVTLDITVKNALDMHGNKMQSPKTWIAYINKNQVKWQDDQFDFEKTVDSVITFVAPIVNSGGAQKAFTIDGLPSWMTASVMSGVIAPNSVQNITFTIPAGGSIGEYDAEVSVTTDFNFAEILRVNLKVKGVVPTWTVNPANFNYSMNVFGQLKIDNVIATNLENKIAAFNNGVICGVANLQYLPAYDRYEVFLNVYSNQITGDSIRFNIYDATSGLTFVNVTPSLMFVENDVVGTVTNPITFIANTEISRDIPLNAGWTWVSFPLKSNKLVTSNSLMTSINPSNGDISTGITDYDQYDANLGWIGNITNNGGYKNNQSYKIKKAIADTLVHIGARLNPDSIQAQINVVPGWNWVGFISNKNVTVTEALGNYNAITGDLIKSQYEFAYYDNLTGWTGSLTHMKPTLGYMLKSTGSSTFNYPLSTFIGKMAQPNNVSSVNEGTQNIFPFTPEQYSNTMSAIITGNICIDALDNGNVAIGAFDNTNTLRGYAYPTLVNNTYKFFLTLYSNGDGETLNVKYFNTTDGLVAPTTTVITFATDALVGTPSTPFVANVDANDACHVVEITTSVNQLDNTTTIGVYPNPFTDNLTLTFNKVINAKVELIDVLGKVVYSSTIKDGKDFNMNFDRGKSNLAIGMYYIRLTGDINQQIKVVKTK